MRKALIISGGGHLALLAVALAGSLFEPDTPEPLTFADVSVISEAQFLANTSRPPAVEPGEVDFIAAPEEQMQEAEVSGVEDEIAVSDATGPQVPSARDSDADLSAVLERPTVDAQTRTSDQAAPAIAPQGSDIAVSRPLPRARPRPAAERPEIAAPAPPRASLNIDTTPDSAPPENVARAEDAREQIAETGEDPTIDAEPQDAAAPEESADQIVPQIAEDQPDVSGDDPDATPVPDSEPLLAAAPPPARPARPAPAEARAQENPVASADPAPAPAPATPARGAPLTGGEIDGFRNAIAQFWNLSVLAGLPNADELVIVVAFTLNEDGTVVNNAVRPVSPARPEGAYLRAFQVAQRAVLQAALSGSIDMPADKYGRWREIEITFDPGNQQIGF